MIYYVNDDVGNSFDWVGDCVASGVGGSGDSAGGGDQKTVVDVGKI